MYLIRFIFIVTVLYYFFLYDVGHGDSSAGSTGSALIGNLLTQKIGSLSSLSQSSGGLGSLGSLSGGSGGSTGGQDSNSGGGSGGTSAGAGINLGAFANLAGVGSQ